MVLMPASVVYPRDDIVSTWGPSSTPPAMTVTVNTGNPQSSGNGNSGGSNSLSSGVVAAIAVVSVLVAICIITASALHLWWCMNPRCRVCLILRCGRRKPRKGQVWDRRSSNVPSVMARSLDKTPISPEKSMGDILDRSPLDRRFPSSSEIGSTLASSPRLQEITGSLPRYINPPSIVSNVAQINTPPVDPVPISSTDMSASPEPAEEVDQNPTEPEPSVEDENHPPSAFTTPLVDAARSRLSHGSGLLSIITLPSFITSDRPRPYSSSTTPQVESPVQPQAHYRKQSSIFSQRFSGTGPSTPISLASDGDTSSKRSRPTSSALQIITSVLKRTSSTSSLRSSSPPSHRSPKRSLGRRGPSVGAEDEATIQWKKLPRIPAVQRTSSVPNRDSQGTSGVERSSVECIPHYAEKEPQQQSSLAVHIPLPPSPSTVASSVSLLSYALPSPQQAPPSDGFTNSYGSHTYPPLPPSIPSTPGPSSYPPLPPSTPSTPGKSGYPPLPPSVPSTPGQIGFPPLPPSIPSTPGRFSFPPLPPSTPGTPGQFGFPPLPPSTPATPGQFGFPPLPPSTPATPGEMGYLPLPPSTPSTPGSTDEFTSVHASHATDPLEINTLRHPSGEIIRNQPDLDTPTAVTASVSPENNGILGDDGTRYSVYRRSGSSCSAYSQCSGVQEVVLPPMPLLALLSSPLPLPSPRGPRPRPLPAVPTQLSRSGTLCSQASSVG